MMKVENTDVGIEPTAGAFHYAEGLYFKRKGNAVAILQGDHKGNGFSLTTEWIPLDSWLSIIGATLHEHEIAKIPNYPKNF